MWRARSRIKTKDIPWVLVWETGWKVTAFSKAANLRVNQKEPKGGKKMLCLGHDQFDAPVRHVWIYLVTCKICGSEVQENDPSWSCSFEYYLNMDVIRSRKMMLSSESLQSSGSFYPRAAAPSKTVVLFCFVLVFLPLITMIRKELMDFI